MLLEKMVSTDLLNAGATDIPFVNYAVSVKCNKMRYDCIRIKTISVQLRGSKNKCFIHIGISV